MELCGISICHGPRSARVRKAIECLSQTNGDGSIVHLGSKQLAEKIGCTKGAGAIPGLIRDLRRQISNTLRQAGIGCDPEEEVLRTNRGYQLAPCLKVQVSGDYHAKLDGAHAAPSRDLPVTNVTDRDVTDVTDPYVISSTEAGSCERRGWIISELAQGRRVTPREVGRKFGCSLRTAKRDMKALNDDRTIEFVGTARTGYYRLRAHV